jgi:hypothetical protein
MWPVPKVGKRHHTRATDTHHFAQHVLGLMHGLQRLRQHHGVELLVTEHRQPLIEVLLDDVDASLDAGNHTLIIDLDTHTLCLLVRMQVVQQVTVTAAKV